MPTVDHLLGRVSSPDNWADRAACKATPDVTFVVTRSQLARKVTDETRKLVARAKLICSTCPVLAECREWSLTWPDPAFEHIAGGLTPPERTKIRRSQPVT